MNVEEDDQLALPKRRRKSEFRRKSGVWVHMRKETPSLAVCELCDNRFKFHGSTTSLWSHLKSKHPAEIGLVEALSEEDHAAEGLSKLMMQRSPGTSGAGTPGGLKKPVKSEVWRYVRKESSDVASCLICNAKFRFHGSTSGLWVHVRSKHPDYIDEALLESNILPPVPVGAQGQETPKSVSFSVKMKTDVEKAKTPTSFKDFPTKKRMLDRNIAEMIATDIQPLDIVEMPGFIRFIHALEPRYTLPNPKQIELELLPYHYKEVLLKVKEQLNNIQHLSVTTEFWTAPDAEGCLTVSVSYLDDQWKICSFVLETCNIPDSYAPENIAAELSRVFTDWNLNSKLTCVVADTSARVNSAIQMLRLPQVTCYAQTIDLVVKESMSNVPGIQHVRDKVREIVSFFQHSATENAKLLLLQKAQDKEPLALRLDVETRWLSTYHMLERFLQLSDVLTNSLYQMGKTDLLLTTDELEFVRHCVKTLEPFEVAVKEMTTDKEMSLSKVIPMTKAISQFMARNLHAVGGDTSGLATQLELHMSKYFQNIEQHFLYGATTMVDPRFKKLPFTNAEAIATLEQQMTEEILIHCEPVVAPKSEIYEQTKSLWSSFDQQVDETISAVSTQQDSAAELTRYYDETPLPRHENPLKWWAKMSKFLTRVSPLARKYLAVPAVSIPAERVFAKSHDAVAHSRCQLKDSVINMVLFLNKNMKTFN